MDVIISIIVLLAIFYLPSKITEWKSMNRVSPKGMHHDCEKAIDDIREHGVQYFHEQNVKGKYDVPGEAVKFDTKEKTE